MSTTRKKAAASRSPRGSSVPVESVDGDMLSLRKRAEKATHPGAGKQMTAAEMARLVHELDVHRIELEIQNEELKETRKRLEESRDRYVDLYDFAPVGYVSTDAKNAITEANLTVCKMLGLTRSMLLGQRITEFLSRDDQDVFYTSRRKCTESGKRQACDVRAKKDNGSAFLAHLEISCAGEGGHAIVRIAILDVTAQSRAQEALRETTDYLESLIRYANAPIIVWDPSHRITRFNQAFERLTGLKAANVIGKHISILFPDDRMSACLDEIHRTLAGGRLESIEIPILCKNNEVRTVLWSSANILEPDGITIRATIAQGQDITERKQVERLKDEFIGMVSHELRTPLTVIMGSLDLAAEPRLTGGERQELYDNALASAELLSNILDNLLELSRYHANRLTLRPQPVRIREIAASAAAEITVQHGKRDFVTKGPAEPLAVKADPVRLKRILYNLLENAAKYSPEGSRIKVAVVPGDGSVTVSVSDRGPGLSAEDVAKLFQPFERLQRTSDQSKGLGLGLVVCKALVEAHGGRIWCESKPGKGSTFIFTLPA